MDLTALLGSEPEANTCRYAGAPGHVESWFLRANDPVRPRAVWLKATILAPLEGDPVAEGWFIWFDGETGRTLAHRHTAPFKDAEFGSQGREVGIRIGPAQFTFGERGEAKGNITASFGKARFKLGWTPAEGGWAQPLSIYPWRVLREGPFPKSKLLTPFPALRFTGSIALPEEQSGGAASAATVSLDGWLGMQGHNWGKEHAFEYAWGQCLFPAAAGAPEAMVEGFTGRVQVGGWTTPRLSAMVVRRGGEEYRFDRIFDFFRQEAHVSRDRWTLRLASADGEARLRMDAGTRPMVCLGYGNPNGKMSYCFNSKLADVLLEVKPARGAPFTCRSPHGGALEFLRREPDPGMPVV